MRCGSGNGGRGLVGGGFGRKQTSLPKFGLARFSSYSFSFAIFPLLLNENK
jgi:hypothetical protein